jgi:predicted permease
MRSPSDKARERSTTPAWRRYLRFWGTNVAEDLDDELGFHLEMRARDYRSRGLTDDEADRAAAKRFGDVHAARSTCLAVGRRVQRRASRTRTLDALGQDLRYGLRTLARQKGWTMVALLTLGLGIGATTAVFSVLDSLILHPIRYPAPDRIARIWRADPKPRGPSLSVEPSGAMIDAWRRYARSIEGIEGFQSRDVTLIGKGDADVVHAGLIDGDFPRFAGVNLLTGRTFLASELERGSDHVVILGEGLWRQRFGGDPAIVGKRITVDDAAYVIIGVAPSALRLPSSRTPRTDLWMPLTRDTVDFGKSTVVRVRPGVRFEAVARELDSIVARTGLRDRAGTKRFVTQLVSPGALLGFRTSLYLLSGAVALLLVVACANVAHLLLARGATRERELAIRHALGAGRGRLVRQLLTESLILAGAGCIIGLAIAVGGVRLLLALRPDDLRELGATQINGSTLAAAIIIALVTGIVFGVTAAIDGARRAAADALRAGTQAASGDRRAQRLRSLLVITEMAVSAMLLVGAVLLTRSVMGLQRADLGFSTRNLYFTEIDLPKSRYGSGGEDAFIDALTRNARLISGVTSASVSFSLPPNSGFLMGSLEPEGSAATDVAPSFIAMNGIQPNYFETLRLPLRVGSTFDSSSAKAGHVIINEGLAKKLWPGQNAVGKRLRFGYAGGGGHGSWSTVVGVAGDLPFLGLTSDRSEPLVYLPFALSGYHPEISISLRTADDVDPSASLRQVVKQLDPRLPPPAVLSAGAALAESIARERFTTTLLAIFAGLAVLLSAIGLYGVIAYVVTQRTREIGIRIALGATPRNIAAAVVARGVVLSVIGLLVGLVAAVWGTRIIRTVLHGVSTTDPLAFFTAAALLLGVSLLACIVPMRRAMRVDPVIAMRGN